MSRSNFNLLDVIRILGGLLLLNAFSSWWFTSSATWGYRGKWIDPRFLQFTLLGQKRQFSLTELQIYDGKNPNLPIYLAVNGSVYDVTAAAPIYGPKGPYRFFSGRDAARAFVTGCFQDPDQFTYDLRGLDPEEAAEDIQKWNLFFRNHRNYWYVGTVDHEPLTGDPPLPCVGMKYPVQKV